MSFYLSIFKDVYQKYYTCMRVVHFNLNIAIK